MSVDVRVKEADYHNELTRYRYDVVLRTGPVAVEDPVAELTWGEDVRTLEELEAWLSGNVPCGSLGSVSAVRVAGCRTRGWRLICTGCGRSMVGAGSRRGLIRRMRRQSREARVRVGGDLVGGRP